MKTNLEQRIKSMDAEDLVFRVVVPSVDEIEIRDGQRRTVPRKIFPGYVLVQMITLKQDDPAVERSRTRRFPARPGSSCATRPASPASSAPAPRRRRWSAAEVHSIIKQMKAEEPRVKVGFQEGQSVRVVDGPFADFVGTVEEINPEKGKVKVAVSIFGRETPVELDFLQVERL